MAIDDDLVIVEDEDSWGRIARVTQQLRGGEQARCSPEVPRPMAPSASSQRQITMPMDVSTASGGQHLLFPVVIDARGLVDDAANDGVTFVPPRSGTASSQSGDTCVCTYLPLSGGPAGALAFVAITPRGDTRLGTWSCSRRTLA